MARRAAASSPGVRPPTPAPRVWVEADFGDSELVVQEHHDGMFTIDMDGARVIVRAEELRPVAVAYAALAAAQGWLETEQASGVSTVSATNDAGAVDVARDAGRGPRRRRALPV